MRETKQEHSRRQLSVLAVAVSVVLAAGFLLLTACGLREDAEPYSAKAAMRKIASYGWVDEAYEIVGEQREDTRPAQTVYFCRSKERPLSFTITAGVYEAFYYNMSLGWKRSVGTNYADKVFSLYRDAAREAARTSPYYAERENAAESGTETTTADSGGTINAGGEAANAGEGSGGTAETDGNGSAETSERDDGIYVFYADSAEALPEIARVICEVNEVYLPEAQYHDGTAWRNYTYIDTARVVRRTKEDGEMLIKAVPLEGVDGTALDEQTLLEELRAAYEEFS